MVSYLLLMIIIKHFTKSFRKGFLIMNKKTTILDLSGCKYLDELHERIKIALKFPDYYGKNLDAFKDFLFWEYPVTRVEVKGASTLPPIFKNNLDIFKKILEQMKKECENEEIPFTYEFN